MIQTADVIELSFEGWGYRELDLAAKLLDRFSDRPTEGGLSEPITLCMNTQSGEVFLMDGLGNVAMMNDGKIEPWYSCPECGHEGFKADMRHGEDTPECQQYLRDIGVLPAESENDDDAPGA